MLSDGYLLDGVVYGDGKSATPPAWRGVCAGGGLAGEGERELQGLLSGLERKTKGMQTTGKLVGG